MYQTFGTTWTTSLQLASQASDECQANIALMVEPCQRLGVPLAEDKLVGACTCLGIEIDTVAGEIRLRSWLDSKMRSVSG